MKNYFIVFILILFVACNTKESLDHSVTVIPISHGTLMLEYKDVVVYIDPIGEASVFEEQNDPDLILITDIHGDHLNVKTLETLVSENTLLVVPFAVSEKLSDSLKSKCSILTNSETIEFKVKSRKVNIEAIPMYNLRDEAKEFHIRGRGNGYVLTLGKERIYISGDTEDIPEMRTLKKIDKAFVCMNLPWTMPIESAASAVLDFKPKEVYPYHYRGTNGLSDTNGFKKIINTNDSEITVHLLNWYPNR